MFFRSWNKDKFNRGLFYRFNMIGLLAIFLPILILSYIIYKSDLSLSHANLIIFALMLLLILAGLAILRYVFDSILSVTDILRKNDVHDGVAPLMISKDITELKEISASFGRLMNRFEKTTADLDQRVFELNTMKEMTEITRKMLHEEELLKVVLEKVMLVVRAQVGSIFTVEASTNRLRLVAATPQDAVEIGTYVNIDESPVKHVLSERKSLIIRDIEHDPRTLKPNDPKYGSPSFLSMPIFTDHSLIAVLNLAKKESGESFDENDERILSIMIGEISFALENAILHGKVKEQLEEIKGKNLSLEKEVEDRRRIEEDLQKVNEELREANEKLTGAYEWMRDSRDRLIKHHGKEENGFVVDRAGKIEEITERALEYTGKSRSELIGSNMLALFDEACHDALREELRQAWMGITRNIQVVMVQTHESEKIFEMSMTRLTSENRRSLLVILR